MAERDSAEEPGTTPGPSESEPGTGWGDVMRTLVADIRRDVAPEWWGAHPELATLEGRNGIVIARAPPDVLDAIGRYLDARRAGALDGEVMPPQLEAHLLDAARGALRPILLGIFEREQKIGRAVVAWEKGDLSAAQAMATEVLSQEPDNDYAQVILRGTANAAESQAPDGRTQKDFDRTRMRFQDARRQQTLDTWIMCWPSVRTWKAVQSVLKKAGASEFRKLAPDFDLLLNRGSVTLEMGDASLHDAVRRLQIETLADIRLSRNVVEEGAQIRVQNFREEARSLRWVLEELVGSLPEGWTWYAARQHVSLTRTGSDQDTKPETRVRYFDVKDILAPGTRPPVNSAEPESGSPPVPPVYRRDPVSGEPVPVKER